MEFIFICFTVVWWAFIIDTVNNLDNAYHKSNSGNYMAPKPGCHMGIVYPLQGRIVIGVPAWKRKFPDFEVCLVTGESD
jgi:hypothetical protein